MPSTTPAKTPTVYSLFGGSVTAIAENKNNHHISDITIHHVGGETTCFFNSRANVATRLIKKGCYASVEVNISVVSVEEARSRVTRISQELAAAQDEVDLLESLERQK